MSINKESYFVTRNAKLATISNREAMGEREIQTLLIMLQAKSAGYELKGKSLIDLGCGDQYIRQAVEKHGASYRGIDINECDLEIDALPISAESTDIVVCLALIEHLSDPGNLIKEVKRVLKAGGILWLSTPDIQACREKFWNDPTHVRPYTRSSLRSLLDMHFFADIIVTPNYRCKPKTYYADTKFNFFRARHLMPFSGVSTLPVPSFLKGGCTGLFALGSKRGQ